MKHTVYLLVCIFFLSCYHEVKERVVTYTVQKNIPLTQLQLSVKASLIEIQKNDIELNGNKVYAIDISGMEIINISGKDYFIQQRNSQQTDFNNYLKHMEEYVNNRNAMNSTAMIADNKVKHAAVMRYLDKMIQQASVNKNIYKVAYYLKADTRDIQYNQLQTTYLDEQFKRIVTDYSHLQ